MKSFVYADNAATTQLDTAVFESMVPWLTGKYGNASQQYAFARAPKKAIAEARSVIAACINALPEEIYFTSGGTESDNWAIKGSFFFDKDKKEIITSKFEHHAVLNACEAIKKLGYSVLYLEPDTEGVIHPETLRQIITNQTKLTSVMLANNEIGSIQPIMKLCDIAHEYGSLFHTDAVQAVGHMPIDVRDIDVDLLSASAHKFNGPKGVGFLYIRRGTNISAFHDGGAQENGLRAGTENVAGIVGMAKALRDNCEQMEKYHHKMLTLEKILIKTIKEAGIDFIRNGSADHLPGSVNLSFRNSNGETLLHRLDLMGIAISTGSACDSVNTQVSHVIQAIKVPEEYAKGTVRVSFGKYNSEEDAEAIGRALVKIIKK